MQDKHVGGYDLSLLPALAALLRRRSVTRAAADVGLTQPAMSRVLARLRDVLDDPLLVRTPAGYVPTPRGEALLPDLGAAMTAAARVFAPPAYDPATERRTVRIAASDVQTVLVLPGVMAHLAREAPGVDVVVEGYGPALTDRLRRGEIDLAFALSSTPLPPGVSSEVVFDDALAVVLRRGHPAAGRRWTTADYATLDHVGIAFVGDRVSDLDARLAADGVTRRVALTTPHFTAALATVAASDMATTVSRRFAAAFAEPFGLVLLDPPFAPATLRTTLVWSGVRASDPFLAWLRTVIADAAIAAGFDRPGAA